MNRTVFIIDGFNLYHSLKVASYKMGGASTKWLNINSLCRSYLATIGNNAQLEKIYYFSALAVHKEINKPGTVKRHQDFIVCLESTGIVVELSRFKEKPLLCLKCNNLIIRHEEKETDVAIAAKLFELLFYNKCDTAVLVTGDTDLAPAVKTTQRLFPSKKIIFAFPFLRHNRELKKMAHGSFTISAKQYLNHQFPDPVVLPDGRRINKPASW